MSEAGGDATFQAQELHLEVHINQDPAALLARFSLRGQTLSASAQTLRELGLRLPAGIGAKSPEIALEQLSGVRVDYDARNQRLDLEVPVQMLDRPTTYLRAGPERSAAAVSDTSPGLLLNYDLHAQQLQGDRDIDGFLELRLFGLGSGTWSSSQNTRLASDRTGQHATSTRFDSRWQLDLPDRMLSLSLGDQLSGALSWSRSARFAGLHIARDFSLQPYRVTTPLSSFAGEAVLPSTVDLYINGVRQASQRVAPGRFQLDAMPALNGIGQAQLRVTDINGHSSALEFPLYGAPELLQPGLSDWSLDIGVLRRDYGIRSFAYDHRPLASASLRHGLGERLTLEAHAEVAQDLQLGGLGAVALLGHRGGMLNASFSGSQAAGLHGSQRSLGYQWNAPGFSVSASTQRRSQHFVDAPAYLRQATLPLRTDRFFVGFGNVHSGQLSLNYISQHYPGNPDTRLAGGGWSRSLPGQAWISLQFNHDLGERGMDNVYLYISAPLDRHTQLSSALRHADDGNGMTLEANHSPAVDNDGWGWRAQTSTGTGAQSSAHLEINHLDEQGRWSLGLDHVSDIGTLAYANSTGSLAWFGSGLHRLRRADDAFVLVSTSGVPGVPIRLQNQRVGSTDARGELLVAPLHAWQRNLLSIDPLALPADMQIDAIEQQVVPAARSGVRATFRLQPGKPLSVHILGLDKRWLPAGTQAEIESQGRIVTRTVIGHDGQLYLDNAPAEARLRVRQDGRECRLALPDPGKPPATPLALEPAQCQP
ncbi:fimbria/pilus outer membrane usher protein [Stenotrophomonas sp.]|uniref:fimbria/pilus outer membrane usher protein n=1 Tax=Stenotrophomonas sp. TaxID=69392 RepID=UPI0028A7D965|nr:fimbria/pilus outer membrane usher protein [Stenotrophomonas sp.]